MAEAVSGTRVPISQTIPDPTRRALLSAVPAAAIGIGAISAATRVLAAPSVVAEATDEQFLAWERESDRLTKSVNTKGLDDDAVDRLVDEQMVFERLIFETPSASRIATQVRVRQLLENVPFLEDDYVTALEHVLAALKAA